MGCSFYRLPADDALPVSSWDTSYIAVATAKVGLGSTASLDRRTLQIVAQERQARRN